MNPRLIVAVVLGLSIVASAQTRRRKPVRKPPVARATVPEKMKLAEGRYRMAGSEEGRAFEEPWTLWKTKLGYELVEQWIFPAQDQGAPRVIDVNVQMVTQLRPIKIHIGDPLLGLDCSLTIGEFVCNNQGQMSKVAVQSPYDFFSPSPWMLGNIVRRARKIKGDKSSIRLVRINTVAAEGAALAAFEAEVQFVGDDLLEVNGRREAASIFELKAAGMIPAMLVWVSEEGLVYAIQDSSRPEQRMELTTFQRFGTM
jgi:hypothetical protein